MIEEIDESFAPPPPELLIVLVAMLECVLSLGIPDVGSFDFQIRATALAIELLGCSFYRRWRADREAKAARHDGDMLPYCSCRARARHDDNPDGERKWEA